MLRRANPERETADWRVVCGRTACTVRRAGRASVLPDPYLWPGAAIRDRWLRGSASGRKAVISLITLPQSRLESCQQSNPFPIGDFKYLLLRQTESGHFIGLRIGLYLHISIVSY